MKRPFYATSTWFSNKLENNFFFMQKFFKVKHSGAYLKENIMHRKINFRSFFFPPFFSLALAFIVTCKKKNVRSSGKTREEIESSPHPRVPFQSGLYPQKVWKSNLFEILLFSLLPKLWHSRDPFYEKISFSVAVPSFYRFWTTVYKTISV